MVASCIEKQTDLKGLSSSLNVDGEVPACAEAPESTPSLAARLFAIVENEDEMRIISYFRLKAL